MLRQVLRRLPVKPLLGLRCVSEPLCSFTCSTRFVKKHFALNTSYCHRSCSIVVRDSKNFYLADVDDVEDSTAVEVAEPVKAQISGAEVVGSCNGLICLWKDEKDIILWNPATSQCRKLPEPPKMPNPFRLTGSSVVAIGYDHLTDDYKVVRTADSQIYGIMVNVYSLKSNSWTRVETITDEIHLEGRYGRYANGALHWLSMKGFDMITIVGFDLGVNRHREMPFPLKSNECHGISLFVLGGCLGVLNLSRMELWLKNDDVDENSWSKLLSVEESHMLRSSQIIWPLTFSRTRKDLLLVVDEKKFMWYNLESNEVKNVKVHGLPDEFKSFVYTPSLVQLESEVEEMSKCDSG